MDTVAAPEGGGSMAQAPRTRLEQHAQTAHLSVRDFVDRFRAVAIEYGEDKAHISERQAKRWLAGESELPRPVCRRVLEQWWAEPLSRLLGPPDRGTVAAVISEEELIVNAGRESVEHAIKAASALDPSALEHLHDAAQRAARAYYVTPPLVMLTDLVRLRDTVYEQLNRTRKPRQQAELYLLAGEVSGLLSSVALDLGRMDVAEMQARVAHTYGSVIDHQSLCAWARTLQSNVYMWCDRPKQAVSIADSALSDAPPGTAKARLHAVRGRAIAMLGGRDEAARSLQISDHELDASGNDTLMDDIGGEFGFDRARHALCLGATYVLLGDAPLAEAGATQALKFFDARLPCERWNAGFLGRRWISVQHACSAPTSPGPRRRLLRCSTWNQSGELKHCPPGSSSSNVGYAQAGIAERRRPVELLMPLNILLLTVLPGPSGEHSHCAGSRVIIISAP
jgi:hypothetical protein